MCAIYSGPSCNFPQPRAREPFRSLRGIHRLTVHRVIADMWTAPSSHSATRRAGTPPGRLQSSHGDAAERSGDRESTEVERGGDTIRIPQSAIFFLLPSSFWLPFSSENLG